MWEVIKKKNLSFRTFMFSFLSSYDVSQKWDFTLSLRPPIHCEGRERTGVRLLPCNEELEIGGLLVLGYQGALFRTHEIGGCTLWSVKVLVVFKDLNGCVLCSFTVRGFHTGYRYRVTMRH